MPKKGNIKEQPQKQTILFLHISVDLCFGMTTPTHSQIIFQLSQETSITHGSYFKLSKFYIQMNNTFTTIHYYFQRSKMSYNCYCILVVFRFTQKSSFFSQSEQTITAWTWTLQLTAAAPGRGFLKILAEQLEKQCELTDEMTEELEESSTGHMDFPSISGIAAYAQWLY